MKLNLQLDVEQINYLLNVLGERPYKESFDIISKIQTQSMHQLNEFKEKENKKDS